MEPTHASGRVNVLEEVWLSPPVAFRLAQNGERQEHCGRAGSLAGEAAGSEEKGEDNEFAIR